ncbi:MAG: hypothetical protein ACK55E_02740 [Cyanobacteriota bacterium]|jgi:hypothetical protein
MDQKFTANCQRVVCAIERYISAGLANDGIDSDSFAPRTVRTTATSESATMPISGLPIRGTLGTQMTWEPHKTDRWLARQRVMIALEDKGNRTYIAPAVPYRAIVESVKAAYAGLANEIVFDCNLANRLFESVGRKYHEPSELINLKDRIAELIRGTYGKIIMSDLIGVALVDVGYVDSESQQFSAWGQAASCLAEKLASLSARTHHDYSVAVFLNAPLLDRAEPIEIADICLSNAPVTLRLGYATDDLISHASPEKAHTRTINTVITMPIRIGVDEPVDRFLSEYEQAERIAQKAVDILRLVSPDDIGILGVEMIRGDSLTPFIARTWESAYDQELSAFFPKRFMFRSPHGSPLAEHKIDIVQRLTKKHIVDEAISPGWKIAIRRFRDMYERHTPDDPEIILTMAVAFEALYLNDAGDSKHELSYRLALRAARFLRRSIDERAEVFDIVRDLYTFRSRVAHGISMKNLKSKDSKKLDRVLDRCPVYLKETLLAFLEGKGPCASSDKDQCRTWRNVELG